MLDELIPEKLARPEDPLAKAIDFLKPLQLLSSGLIETHLLTFEIYYRKNKLLIMLQALKRAYKIDPENATLHGCIVRFIQLLDKQLCNANEFVKIVIKKETESELPIIGKNSKQVNDEFIARNKDSAEAVIAGALAHYNESPTSKTKAIDTLILSTQLKSFSLTVSLLTSGNKVQFLILLYFNSSTLNTFTTL